MKNVVHFFFRYYLKKHLGFLANAQIQPADIFWKNFYRLRSALTVAVLKDSPQYLLLECVINNTSCRCYLRKAPSSDIFVYRQIFENKEYLPLVQLVQNTSVAGVPALIIDAGANVGYTTVFFKLFFPQCMVVAIEPDEQNAKQIKENLTVNQMDKTDILVAGVWSHDCWLELKKDKSKGEDWGYYVQESILPTNLKAIDILNLPQLANDGLIDILKIDIEGGEVKLFENKEKASRLLSVTKYLAIEIHDAVADRKAIEQLLTVNHFTWFNAGELTIATNGKLAN